MKQQYHFLHSWNSAFFFFFLVLSKKSKNQWNQFRENILILQLLFSGIANFFLQHLDFFSPEGSNFSVIYNSLAMCKVALLHRRYAFFSAYSSTLANHQGQLGFLSLRVRLGKPVFWGLPVGDMKSLRMSAQNSCFKCHGKENTLRFQMCHWKVFIYVWFSIAHVSCTLSHKPVFHSKSFTY